MPTYKNISNFAQTFFNVTFQPGETKTVPGFINSTAFIRIDDGGGVGPIPIPNTSEYIRPGAVIQIGRFSTTRWKVEHGWFSVGGNRPWCGWYLTDVSNPSNVRAIQLTDLDDIYMIEEGPATSLWQTSDIDIRDLMILEYGGESFLSENSRVRFYKGKKADMPSTKIEGCVYACEDTGELFLDTSSGTRIPLGPEFINETDDTITVRIGTREFVLKKAGGSDAPSTYTVTYNANGHGTAPTKQTTTTGSVTLPTMSNVTGYTFKGWATSASATSAMYSGGQTISVVSDTTLYAVWQASTPTQYIITFDSQGGTAVSPKTITAGEQVGTLPTSTKSGNTFDGWYTAISGGTKVTTATVPSSNVTYYAHWTATVTNYTVTFDPSGGSVSEATRQVASGAQVGTLPTPTRSGYTFNGWFTSSTGGTQINASRTITGNVTFYAQWTAVTPSGTTVYYAKASSGTAITELSQMTPITVSGTSVDIPINSVSNEFIFIAYPSDKTVTILDQGGLEESWTERTISDVGYTLRRSGKITDSSSSALYHITIS